MSPTYRTVFSALLLLAGFAAAQPAVDLPRQSPQASVSQTFGYTTAIVKYGRPAVNGRVIWGGVVPHGQIWRAGANEPTTIEFTRDVTVNGSPLAAGTYALFVMPVPPEKKGGKDAWTFIFSRNTKGWGAYGYNATEDALRVTVTPQKITHQERMAFTFENVHDGGVTLALNWEKRGGSLNIAAEFLETGKANIAKGLPNVKADDPYAWLHSARFYWTYDIDRKQALEWVDKSIAVKPLFNNLWAKAEWLAAEGSRKEALDAAGLAISEAEKDPNLSSQVPALNKTRKSLCKGG